MGTIILLISLTSVLIIRIAYFFKYESSNL